MATRGRPTDPEPLSITMDGDYVPSDREVRDKLVMCGPVTLSDAELLGAILGESAGEYSAVGVAKDILAENSESLARLSVLDVGQLRQVAGIGARRSVVLAAAFELARRIQAAEPTENPEYITSKNHVCQLLGYYMSMLRHEEMWVIYLSSANRVIDKIRVSQGGVSALLVDYKLVVKRAVDTLATSMIIVHNHPSEVARPSDEDIAITHRIAEAAALFDIFLLDHVIIAGKATYSFRENNFLR